MGIVPSNVCQLVLHLEALKGKVKHLLRLPSFERQSGCVMESFMGLLRRTVMVAEVQSGKPRSDSSSQFVLSLE